MTSRAQALADAVKGRRAELRLSQEDLALAINEAGERVSIQNLRLIEQGKRESIRRDTEIAIAKGLRWPADAVRRILDGEDWRGIETVEPSSEVASLRAEVAELRARVDRLEKGDVVPLTPEEQDIMELPWPAERKRELILQMREREPQHAEG